VEAPEREHSALRIEKLWIIHLERSEALQIFGTPDHPAEFPFDLRAVHFDFCGALFARAGDAGCLTPQLASYFLDAPSFLRAETGRYLLPLPGELKQARIHALEERKQLPVSQDVPHNGRRIRRFLAVVQSFQCGIQPAVEFRQLSEFGINLLHALSGDVELVVFGAGLGQVIHHCRRRFCDCPA